MKKNNVFFHPVLKEYCIITRKYSNSSWYFKKVSNKDKEYKAIIDLSEIKEPTDILQVGDIVKINVSEIFKGKFNRTLTFNNFLKENKETLFKVSKIDGEIVSLENCIFTFWIGHLYKLA